MNLKLVVASMSVLGLVSCPVFAATTAKHKHHHHVRHMRAHPDYKGMGNLPVQPAMMVEAACTVTPTSVIVDETTQNLGRSLPNPCNPGWFNRIAFSGGINVDLGKFGARNFSYMGENYQRVSLNDAYLNAAATINEWAKAFASISYNTATINADGQADSSGIYGTSEYSAAYSNNVAGNRTNALQLEQAYATLGNFDISPIYVEVGKQFQDFSRYEIHAITRSLTQVMSETLATSLKVGLITPMGFHGSLYVFDDPLTKVNRSARSTNYGASIGFNQPGQQLGFGLGAAYLYNMIGVNDVAFNVVNFEPVGINAYQTRVGAVALYGDVNSGPFSLSGRYTTALQRFNVNDLPQNGVADFTGRVITGKPRGTAAGAKPWAAGIQVDYGFEGWCKNQNVYLGYQTSRQAAGLKLPKNRWLVGYGIEWWKNTNLAVEWDRDLAYNVASGGTGNNTNLVSLRSSVKFG